MSNNLFDITTSSTNITDDTLTLTDGFVNIQVNSTIYKAPMYIDNTNNYAYYIVSRANQNITTSVDIKDLGFIIIGDSNDYNNFNYTQDETWSLSYISDTYTVYDSCESTTNVIIENYSPTNPPSGIISDDKHKNGIKYNDFRH